MPFQTLKALNAVLDVPNTATSPDPRPFNDALWARTVESDTISSMSSGWLYHLWDPSVAYVHLSFHGVETSPVRQAYCFIFHDLESTVARRRFGQRAFRA